MAYSDSSVDKVTSNMSTVTWTGDGSDTNDITGVGFNADLVWIKKRGSSGSHVLTNSVYGHTKYTSIDSSSSRSDFTMISNKGNDGYRVANHTWTNHGSQTFCGWNFKAGGTTPSQTYTVTVVSSGGNKYRFDGNSNNAITLDLQEGGTYTFDQSHSSNAGHPLRFSTTSNGTHGGGSEYTTGVTTNGTPGSSGAYTRITIAASAPTLYYYCTQHSGMGGQINTQDTLHGSSQVTGSIQSVASVHATGAMSIVKYEGSFSSGQTVGHGMGRAPELILFKNTDNNEDWLVYNDDIGAGTHFMRVKNQSVVQDNGPFDNTAATTTNFAVGHNYNTNHQSMIAYCFASVPGFCSVGAWTGNGSSDGPFVYTGFRPTWIMHKDSNSNEHWQIKDTTRRTINPNYHPLYPSLDNAEGSNTNSSIDFLSNGFKIRNNDGSHNTSTNKYVYVAFGQTLVGSNDVYTKAV